MTAKQTWKILFREGRRAGCSVYYIGVVYRATMRIKECS